MRATLEKWPRASEPSKLCNRCENLPLWSQNCTFSDTLACLEASSASCSFCGLLIGSLATWVVLPDETLKFFRMDSSLRFNNKQLPPLVSFSTLPSMCFEFQGVNASDLGLVLKGAGQSEHIERHVQLGFPKLPDPGSPTNCKLLHEWIRDCNDNHKCVDTQAEPFLPTRLLDVGPQHSERSRLICDTRGFSKDKRYLAMSHRWGAPLTPGEPNPYGGQIVCTLESNIRRLQEGVTDSELPPKYRDGVYITRQLGIHYLWIDSLCIIQHDRNDPLDKDQGRDWAKEAERMEQVFRSAYATIAASCASSAAEHFLVPRPETRFITLKTGDNWYHASEAIDSFFEDVEQGELNKRAWVFQERALSRRTIYFTEKLTYWECGEGVRCETLKRTKK